MQKQLLVVYTIAKTHLFLKQTDKSSVDISLIKQYTCSLSISLFGGRGRGRGRTRRSPLALGRPDTQINTRIALGPWAPTCIDPERHRYFLTEITGPVTLFERSVPFFCVCRVNGPSVFAWKFPRQLSVF